MPRSYVPLKITKAGYVRETYTFTLAELLAAGKAQRAANPMLAEMPDIGVHKAITVEISPTDNREGFNFEFFGESAPR